MTPRDIDRLRKWLAQNGAEILVPTNRYELLRSRARGVVSVVYRNAAGRVSACTRYAETGPRACTTRLTGCSLRRILIRISERLIVHRRGT